MLRIVALTIALLPLAACDTPDPSSFPKHALRENASTGSHISSSDSTGDTVSTDNTHQIQRITSGGNGLGGGSNGGH